MRNPALKMVELARPGAFTWGQAPDWRRHSFDWQAGRPAAIILAPDVPAAEVTPLLEHFTRRTQNFVEKRADVLMLAGAAEAEELRRRCTPPSCVEIITCDAAFLAECGVTSGETRVFVVDRNMRVAMACAPGAAGDVVAACLLCLGELQPAVPAPVLILPNLLPRELCRTLIDRFESGDSIAGKVAGVTAAGLPHSYVDRSIKLRRDLQIRIDDPLHPLLRSALLARCGPEIAKSFKMQVGHADRLMLSRYDAPDGRFRRHRDDSGPSTAFREFAISVNLNAGEYDGGGLLFPEYNDTPVCPPTGGGVIFSASLLHEVAAVTRGRRYVLLTFLHSAAAEQRRHAPER